MYKPGGVHGAPMSGGIMNEVHIYICLFCILHIFFSKQSLILLFNIIHASYLKQIRKNLSVSLREQFCKLPQTPSARRKPLCVCMWGDVVSRLEGEEEGPREF